MTNQATQTPTKRAHVILAMIIFTSGARASLAADFKTCADDPVRLQRRSDEVQKIVAADQSDRQDPDRIFRDEIFRNQVLKRDEARRKRIGEIFGEGCFQKAADFSAAALVFQHGNTPDHFFQTYIWSKRAVDLGDTSQKRMMGLGIDRYLVNIGQKQLFASQASKPLDSACWCLEQVEETYPDSDRKATTGQTLTEALEWVGTLNKDHPECAAPTQCANKPLKPTPRGTVPGLW
jgi:hypothetical protein